MGESFYFHRHSESPVHSGDSLSQLILIPGGSSNRSATDTKVKNLQPIKILTEKWEKISESIRGDESLLWIATIESCADILDAKVSPVKDLLFFYYTLEHFELDKETMKLEFVLYFDEETSRLSYYPFITQEFSVILNLIHYDLQVTLHVLHKRVTGKKAAPQTALFRTKGS